MFDTFSHHHQHLPKPAVVSPHGKDGRSTYTQIQRQSLPSAKNTKDVLCPYFAGLTAYTAAKNRRSHCRNHNSILNLNHAYASQSLEITTITTYIPAPACGSRTRTHQIKKGSGLITMAQTRTSSRIFTVMRDRGQIQRLWPRLLMWATATPLNTGLIP